MMHLKRNKEKTGIFARRRMCAAAGVLAAALISTSCNQSVTPTGAEVDVQMNTNLTEATVSEKEISTAKQEETAKPADEPGIKEIETKEIETKEIETKEIETKETETKEVEIKETGTKETEIKETEIKETETTETDSETTTENSTEPESERIPEIEPKETQAVYGTEEDSFFENSVFVGDSVMMGFRNYILKQEEGFLGNPEFLVSGSYSLRMALNPVSDKTIHPIYQGEQRLIWDSMKMMGVDKVFLFFGLNDIGMLSVDTTYENYLKVIASIYETNPDISIYILSTTNIYNGSEIGSLNNENVRLLNQKMKDYCTESKEEFIDIADYLIDENGYLKEEYCSDNYVHQTPEAYDIWIQVLREFARRQQNGQTAKQYNLPKET